MRRGDGSHARFVALNDLHIWRTIATSVANHIRRRKCAGIHTLTCYRKLLQKPKPTNGFTLVKMSNCLFVQLVFFFIYLRVADSTLTVCRFVFLLFTLIFCLFSCGQRHYSVFFFAIEL